MGPEISCLSLIYKITNVPVVYMGLDVWIWMGGNPFLGAFEGVGPRYGLLPRPKAYVPPHINNRYINS
jgi:hypothetical protein